MLDELYYVPVDLGCAEVQIAKDVRVLTSTDHTLLELRAILSNQISNALTVLEFHSHVEVLCHHLVRSEVSDSLFQKWFLSADFNHVVD